MHPSTFPHDHAFSRPPAHPNASHHQTFLGRRQAIGAENARPVEYQSSLFQCTAGIFGGQTIRAKVDEIQKADVGRKYAASKDRRALDPPPVAELRIWEVADSDRRIEREVDYGILQPTGLICHIEVFSVTLNTSEQPSQVTDLPEPCPPPAASRHGANESDSNAVLAYCRGEPITAANNCTSALVGDVFTQALNLPIGHNGEHKLLFVFPDVSVQLEGWFVLRYRVFDLFSVNIGSQPILAETWGRPFRIYATKQFPGLEPSTELTKLLHRHHVSVRSREVRRKRKRNSTQGVHESEEESEQDRVRT